MQSDISQATSTRQFNTARFNQLTTNPPFNHQTPQHPNAALNVKLFMQRRLIIMFIWPLITGALLSSAQYSCDSSRLIRCQQDALRDMQSLGINAASIQYPISGPPYSPAQKQQLLQSGQLVSPTTCRLVRSNLDCLLQTTPACYDQGVQSAQNTDIILRAKRFLEQNNCNDPDSTWQSTFCYRSPEIRSCEERYGFTSYTSSAANLLASANNLTACLAYSAFKYCVESHLRLNCKVHEMDMANEYLIDRASDLAWRCPPNSTATGVLGGGLLGSRSPYQLNNQPGSVLVPASQLSHYSSLGHAYDAIQQRQIPAYVGSTGNLNLFSSSANNALRGQSDLQAWERFRNPLDDGVARYGVSRYPNSGSGEVFDRLVAANSFGESDTSDCPIKAAPYARECEDTLMEQQRMARDSRDGNELQRRICW